MVRIWALVVLAGCGRLEFDPLIDASAVVEDDAFINLCPHTFCDDFDRATSIVTGWDTEVATGGALAIVSDESVSAPQSLLVAMPTAAVGPAHLTKTFPMTATHARISFDLSYTSATPGIAEIDLVQLSWLALPAGCTNFGYYIVRNSTGPLIMQETYTGCGGNINTPLVFGTGFHHIAMDIYFGSVGTARVTVEIDGALMFDTMPTRAIPASALVLDLGVASQRDIIAPWQVRYDNVVIDLE